MSSNLPSSLSRRRVYSASSSRQDVMNGPVDVVSRGGDSIPVSPRSTSYRYGKKRDDTDVPFSIFGRNVTTTVAASWTGLFLKSFLGMTVALYVLNQQHMLPKPLSEIVSKALFWPTLPITASRRIGTWSTVVDKTVVIGGAPLGFLGLPEKLYNEYGVRGVINMCKEYPGPTKEYKRLGITELWLPTVDHFEPSVQDLKSAVAFIEAHKARGDRVYVHCRAGHGRSAAVVFAYLLNEDPGVDPMQLNAEFCRIRDVRKTLWRQPNIRQFHSWVKSGGKIRLNIRLDPDNTVMDPTLLEDSDGSSNEY